MEWRNEKNEAIDHLTQWEIGRVISVEGLETSKNYNAHIYNNYSEKAEKVACENVSGTLKIKIPDKLLQMAEIITVIIYEKTINYNIAVERKDIPVEDAKMPEDYIFVEPEKNGINYADLKNKPKINGVELNGNMTNQQLKIPTVQEIIDSLPKWTGGVY